MVMIKWQLTMKATLDTPAQYLKGVGPKVAKLLKKLGIETIEDLIYSFPRDYEDRSKIKPIAELRSAELEIIKGEICRINNQVTRNRFSVLKVMLADRSGSIQAVWFNQPYLTKLFRPGMKLIISGRIEYSTFDNTLQISVRDFEIDTGANPIIVAHYPLTDRLYPKKMRSIIKTAVEEHLTNVQDILPKKIKKKYNLCDLRDAIHTLHFPDNLAKVDPARYRLAFDDFFFFQLGLGLRKHKASTAKGVSFYIDQDILDSFLKTLPFELTGAQKMVLEDILSDMKSNHPMNRLLQGDVGSGKTIVAALASLVAIKSGYQVVIMAPTEILAQQHFTKLSTLFKASKIKIKLMTRSTKKGKSTKSDLFVGTHALIQEKVQFEKLGLAIVDEQHRFGVMQRENLVKKGINPDVLIMTATPIPRSLALTLYGDLDRSVIDEMPPGRTPIETHYVPEKKRRSSYEFMRKKVKEGRQIFVVCPLVEESEKVDLKAAMDEAESLQKNVFPEFKVGLLHGRMKGDEKDKIMKQFREEKIHILVSTTVIEVGIDIPNATVMVIEHAERFGLSQLHQLRGRIGRGSEQSYCFMLANPKSADAKARIKAMVESTDGFHIAEVDLQIRGPGDVCGTRQSGMPEFRVADLIRDEKILRLAREAAFNLLEKDPNLEENQVLKHSMAVRYGKIFGY